MAEEILVLVVRDSSGNNKELADLVDASTDKWAMRVTDPLTVALLADVKRSVSDYRTLLDYAGRTDSNPVYVGKNLQTAALSAGTWVIQKLLYDTNVPPRLIDVQVLTGIWNDRETLGWA